MMANNTSSPKYGIGEWHGQSAADMGDVERLAAARREVSTRSMTVDCPFDPPRKCNKKGGICTIRQYVRHDPSGAVPANDLLCTVCPRRFWDSDMVVRWIGKTLLNVEEPIQIREVEFLRTDTDNAAGRIDAILCDPKSIGTDLRWCAVETQSVYFSGTAMSVEFESLVQLQGKMPFPQQRRPDFRSSSSKRLEPQLTTKCPTLSRWGKKTAVVVDRPFFDSLSNMSKAQGIENSDVVWFVVSYKRKNNRFQIVPEEYVPVTLRDAQDGLRNAMPVNLDEFEREILARAKEMM